MIIMWIYLVSRKLQCDVDKLRKFVVHENEDKCVRCGIEFWWLFRSAELCETCRKKVCANCRHPVKDSKANQCWLCILCHKERYVYECNQSIFRVLYMPSN